jgi:hypothetical protein
MANFAEALGFIHHLAAEETKSLWHCAFCTDLWNPEYKLKIYFLMRQFIGMGTLTRIFFTFPGMFHWF